jgi:tRNA (guanine-N7-)-methyltransferase
MSSGLSRGKPLITEGFGIEQKDLPCLDAGRLDPRKWFEHPQRTVEIEIGCGKGTFLLQQARLRPEANYVGFEWSREFFKFAADRMRRHGLANVRVVHDDATEFLRHRCCDSIAAVVHLYFSDPWPKKRHHKRRVVQDRTLQDLHRVLAPRGELRLVTDHQALWAWYEDHALRHEDLFERCLFAAPDSAGEGEVVGSNFERKYRAQGRPFFAMTLIKKQ